MFASYAETSPVPSVLENPGPGSTHPRSRRSIRRLFSAILRNDYSGARRALVRADLTQVWPASGESPLEAAVHARRPSLVHLIGTRLKAVQKDSSLLAFSQALTCLLEGWPRQSSQAFLDQACLEALLDCVDLPLLPPPEQGWMLLALPSDNASLLGALKDAGLSLTETGGNHLLHLAVLHGAPSLVQWCLEELQVDPNLANGQGQTPLHIAVQCGNLSLARRLLEAGANPDIPDTHSCTPLSLAVGLGEEGHRWSAQVRWGKLETLSNSDRLPSSPSTRL